MTTTAARQQQRRGTASAWSTANPVLAAGEFGYVTGGRPKIGDGTTAWDDLPFFSYDSTFHVADYGAVGDNSTDDTAAIQAAIDAAVTAGVAAGSNYGVVEFDALTYKIAGALQTTSNFNCQIRLPLIANTAAKFTIVLRGASPAHADAAYGQTALNTGTVLRSTLTGKTYGGRGIPSIIGGPTEVLDAHTTPANFTNVMVVVDGLCLRAPDNPTVTALDLSECSNAYLRSIRVDTAVADSAITLPTHAHAYGIILPATDNQSMVRIDNAFVWGFYVGIGWAECSEISSAFTYKCKIGFSPTMATNHGAHMGLVFVSDCPYLLAANDPSSGPTDLAAIATVVIDLLSTENPATGDFASIAHIRDTDGFLRGSVSFVRVVPDAGPTTDDLVNTGAANIRQRNMVAEASTDSGLPSATSKGTLAVFDGDTWATLDPPDVDGQVLTSLASAPTGLAWATPADPVTEDFRSVALADTPGALWMFSAGGDNPPDVTGNGHDLSLRTGATTYTTDDPLGPVLDLSAGDWTHDYRLPQDAYTIEAVARRVTSGDSEAVLISDWGGDAVAGAMLLGVSGTMTAYHAADTLALGSIDTDWHHWVSTWDGTTMKVYLDGSLVTSRSEGSAPGLATGAGTARVSNYGTPTAGRQFPGYLYAGGIYPAALDADQVLAHFTALAL